MQASALRRAPRQSSYYSGSLTPGCVLQDTEALRGALPGMSLIAFVGDGAILPRCARHAIRIQPAAFVQL